MSNRKHQCNNYIFVVDSYRAPSMKRNTQGRYKVGAKNSKEAVKLLQEKIGFGDITLLYSVDNDYPVDPLSPPVGYKEVFQEVVSKGTKWKYEHVQPHHASDRADTWEAISVISKKGTV